jgi:hypothetical protein
MVKSEGIAPPQYGTKGLVGDKLAEVELKYDLGKGVEGFGVLGANGRNLKTILQKQRNGKPGRERG